MYGLKISTRDESLTDKVRRVILENGLIAKGDTVVAAVSGGADSVCLLLCLSALSSELGFTVVAAHLNHMIRGAEADSDENFVKELCESLNVKLYTKHVDVPMLAKGKTLEEAGREERYKLFNEVGEAFGKFKIAVAHNENDLAETMIMRLARGTSLFGISGIHMVNGNVIRPLLYVTRAEIEAFLKEQNSKYVTDSTNLSDDYTRNRIRHKILPELERLNPSYLTAMANTAKRLSDAAELVKNTASREYGEITDSIDTEKLLTLDKTVMEYVASKSAYMAGVKELSGKQLASLIRLSGISSGKEIELPGGISAKKIYSKIAFSKHKERSTYETELHEGENYVDGYIVTVSKSKRGIDLEKVSLPLYARPRIAGDIINPVGMTGSKKVKNIYIDEKLPLDKRENYPVIVSGGKVLFALGHCDKGCASDENTKQAFTIKITEGDSHK